MTDDTHLGESPQDELPYLVSKLLRLPSDQEHKYRAGRLILTEDAVYYCSFPDADPAFCWALIACLNTSLEAFEQEFEVFDTQAMTLYSGYNTLWVVEATCGPVKQLNASTHNILCFKEFN